MLCHVDWRIINDVSKEFISYTLNAKQLYRGLLEPPDEGSAMFVSVKMYNAR